jgi:hypothetical protein
LVEIVRIFLNEKETWMEFLIFRKLTVNEKAGHDQGNVGSDFGFLVEIRNRNLEIQSLF